MKKDLKKPKIQDIISFITSNKEVPENFFYYEKDLKNLVNHIFEWFWNQPKFIVYLNKLNNLFDRDINNYPIEFLKFLQTLCIQNKISKYDLKNTFFNYFQESNKIKELENQAIKNKKQLIDLITEIKIKNVLGHKIEIKKVTQIKNKNDKEKLKTKIKTSLENNLKKSLIKNTNQKIEQEKYLKELNEDIIDELQLTLFDVFLDDKHNQLIYIFIDKNYKKRYYIEPFHAEILLSLDQNFKDNDYIKDINPEKFIKYRIMNIWQYNQIIKAVKQNFENIKIYY